MPDARLYETFDEVIDVWSPPAASTTGRIGAETTERLAALLGRPVPAGSEPLPLLWHEVHLRDALGMAELGADGHPVGGPLLPPVADRRRMFGGARVDVVQPLRVGEVATRTSRVIDVRAREGRSGSLLLVTEEHEWTVDDEPRLLESRDIVYRRASDVSAAPPTPGDDATPSGTDHRTVVPDERYLFAYSALTYNLHRIHYDATYATGVEHHPALVVHGPLLALWCADHAAELGGRQPAHVSYRLTATAYVGQPVTLAALTDGDQLTVEAWSGGRCCVRLTATA